MKKFDKIIFTLCMLLIPFGNVVFASDSGINKYYMDATIEKDGSVHVKELFDLNGSYNGFERIIETENTTASKFDAKADMYGGSSLHNASDLNLIAIKGIPKKDLSFSSFSEKGILFHSRKNGGDTDQYYEEMGNHSSQYRYRIYNSSNNQLAFYLEYQLRNMAILHDDIAELGWNIFSDKLVEDVEEFELLIHLPGNKKELRAWAHGPLNGNIEVIDQETVKVTISDLAKQTPFDVRLAFDKDVIANSTKATGVVALDKILKYEQVKADEANALRKEARIKYYGTAILCTLWLIGWIILIIYTYLKHDKEYQSKIKVSYYRELPNTYGPEIVGYLMHHQVKPNDLSAAIMNLISKKVIKAEKVMTGKKEDYKLVYLPENVAQTELSVGDTNLIYWLFHERESLLLSTLKKEAKTDYIDFLKSYEAWKGITINSGEEQNFFLVNTKPKVILIFYSILGIVCGVLASNVTLPIMITVGLIILGIFGIIYGCCYQKRTQYGNDEFVKWQAFKKFLLDFGNFSEKELPEIVLWEKYLVYAVALDCADKVAKQMELKVKELSTADYQTGYPTFTDFYVITSLNRSISSGVSSAVSQAISTRAMAQSNNSSGSGFGGGFSSGGGSFGGGGGGGRF